MEMHAFGRLTNVNVARRRLIAAARPIERVEPVPVDEAFGRVAAVTVRAPFPVPNFPRTTWDGYALRAADTRRARKDRPVDLEVVGEVFAEQAYVGRLQPGEAVAIATGGAIPAGADGVVIFEEVERNGTTVRLRSPVRAGDRISRPGHDFSRGSVLVRPGTELTAAELGTLAACGLAEIRVYARPVVAILPNGNELLAPGTAPRPGMIFESNNAAIRSALVESDLVLATGGSSVGERDHLPRILPRFGDLLFHGIAVRAGKPTLAARAGPKLIVGLPGHPTSCLANMYWLVLPVLRRIARRPGPGWREGWAVLGHDAMAPSPGLATVVPLRFERGKAYSTFRGSSVITSLSGATAFALLPPGRTRVRAGERIRVCHLLPPLGTGGVT